MSNPCAPVNLSSNTDLEDGRQVAIHNGKAYIANGEFGLAIYNISNPSSPVLLGSYSGATMPANSIIVGNGKAFVGPTGNNGFRILDISNPSNPILVGTHDLSDEGIPTSGGLSISGDHVYAATTNGGLQILNVSNPVNPVVCGTYDNDIYAASVTVRGGLAYFGGANLNTTGNGILSVLDISSPCAPSLEGSIEIGEFIDDIALKDNFAYVVDTHVAMMRIINIGNPASPQPVSSLPIPTGSLRAIGVAGDLAYLTSSSNGLQIVNVASPTTPGLIASYDTPGSAQDLVISQGLVFVADGSGGGLQVLDISAPASPTLVGSYDTAGSARGVSVVGDLAYLADGSGGLVVLELGDFRPPLVTITYPVFATTFATSSSSINLGGVASDDHSVVQVTWVNNRGGNGIAGGTPTNWTAVNIVLQPGENIITVAAVDERGNTGVDIITVTYNAPPDTQVPTIQITAPTNQPTLATQSSIVALGGTASDNQELSQITWTNDRGGSGNATGLANWNAASIPLQPGVNIITATAIDTSGNIGIDTLTVTSALNVATFVNVLVGIDTDPSHVQASDFNGDGAANGADIQGMISALLP